MMYNYLVTGKPPAESRIKVKGKILTKDGLQD